MTLIPNKQLLVNAPFQSTKNRKKDLCVDNKVRYTFGDVYCPTWRNEKCVYISSNKTTSLYDCKIFKACCHVLNIPFRDQKSTLMLFGGDSTLCSARKRSRDYEKEVPSPFVKKFFKQGHPNPKQKMQKLFHLWHIRVDTPLGDTVNQSFIHFITLNTFSQH